MRLPDGQPVGCR